MSRKTEENKTENKKTSEILIANNQNPEVFEENDSDENAIDADFNDIPKSEIIIDTNETAKEENKVASLLANLKTDQNVSIIITRLADKQYAGQFRIPFSIDQKMDTIYWDGEPYPDSIYEYVRKNYGGGHFRFQLRYGGYFQEAWKEVLGDPPYKTEFEKTRDKEEANNDEQTRNDTVSQQFATPTAPVDPLTAEIERLEKHEKLKQLLAGKELEELNQLKSRLNIPEQQASAAKLSKLDFIMAIYKETQDVTHKRTILNSLLDIETPAPAPPEPKGFFGTIAQHFETSPTLQKVTAQALEGGLKLVTSYLQPPPLTQNANAAPTILKMPQVSAQPAPAPQPQPQPAPAPENNVAPDPPVVKTKIPLIKIGDTQK